MERPKCLECGESQTHQLEEPGVAEIRAKVR